VSDFDGRRVIPVAIPLATPEELRDPRLKLLPHVEPDTTGNLCLPAEQAR